MKTSLGALLALSLALPASAAGPTVRAGRLAPTTLPVGGPTLGVSGANLSIAPSLGLAVPALAPSLTPSLAPNAAPLAAAPLAAAPLAAAPLAASEGRKPEGLPLAAGLGPEQAARSVDREALSAQIASAHQALESGDEAGARSAAARPFEGARVAAASDGPAVPEGAGSAPRRLAPPSQQEIVDAYRAAKPGSTAVDFFSPREFVAAAADLTMQYTFASRGFIEGLESSIPFFDRKGRQFLAAVKDLVAAHDAPDAASRRYSELLGRYYAYMDAGQDQMKAVMSLFMGRGQEQPHMPPAPKGVAGEYWDMAAGINGGRYVRRPEVDKATPYVMFDLSPFAAAYIRESAAMAGKSNVTTREEDLMRIARPAKPLAVLRTKNAVAYVPGFASKLEEMVDWIAPRGQLIIQTDPGPGRHQFLIQHHETLVRRLLREGWTLEYGFSGGAGELGRYGYDSLVLTRPADGAARADQSAAWSRYLESVRYADRRYGF